jgi:hypothetical protein
MEHLILLIGIFLGGPQPDVKIMDKFMNPQLCMRQAKDLNTKAKTEDAPYRFYCRPVSATVA